MDRFLLDKGVTTFAHASAMLTVHDLGGAMEACRTMRRVVPQAVYAPNGLNLSVLTDNVLNATPCHFSFISAIDRTGCHKLRNIDALSSEHSTVDLCRCSNLFFSLSNPVDTLVVRNIVYQQALSTCCNELSRLLSRRTS